MTPLHLAAEKGNLQAVKKLMENVSCPADLALQNKVTLCRMLLLHPRRPYIGRDRFGENGETSDKTTATWIGTFLAP